MLEVHCAQVAVFQKVFVVNLACCSLVELLYQFCHLSICDFHLSLRETLDEGIIRHEAILSWVLLSQHFLETLNVIWGNLLTQVLKSCVLDFGLSEDLINSLENLRWDSAVSNNSGLQRLLGLGYDPVMGEAIFRSKTCLVVFDKALLYEILALFTYRLKCRMVEVEYALDNILNDLWLCSPWERNLSWKHYIEDHTHAPDVDFHIILLKENLRGNVVRRTWHCVHCCLLWKVLWKTKINHLDACHIILFVKHKIFRLDISMGNLFAVNVVQRRK